MRQYCQNISVGTINIPRVIITNICDESLALVSVEKSLSHSDSSSMLYVLIPFSSYFNVLKSVLESANFP